MRILYARRRTWEFILYMYAVVFSYTWRPLKFKRNPDHNSSENFCI